MPKLRAFCCRRTDKRTVNVEKLSLIVFFYKHCRDMHKTRLCLKDGWVETPISVQKFTTKNKKKTFIWKNICSWWWKLINRDLHYNKLISMTDRQTDQVNYIIFAHWYWKLSFIIQFSLLRSGRTDRQNNFVPK